jgi:hypothetical protein
MQQNTRSRSSGSEPLLVTQKEIHGPGDLLKLECAGLELPIKSLYDGLGWEA